MSFRLDVDADSVLGAAESVQRVGRRLDGAPGGAALRTVAASLPGGELAAAAGDEAAEWASEMASVAEVFERYTQALERAVAGQRQTDATGASRLRGAR